MSRAEHRLSVFFDVDDTILTWDHRLRPHTRHVMTELVSMGCEVFVWSGVGPRWEILHVHELGPLVRDCYTKPLSRHHERLQDLGIPLVPGHVVDDDLEIVHAFGGTHVPAPLEPLDQDRELLRVVDDVTRRLAVR